MPFFFFSDFLFMIKAIIKRLKFISESLYAGHSAWNIAKKAEVTGNKSLEVVLLT